MMTKLLSGEGLEQFYQVELVKYGVTSSLAQQAAKILACSKPDEDLTNQEIQLVTQVCTEWLQQRKRLISILKNH